MHHPWHLDAWLSLILAVVWAVTGLGGGGFGKDNRVSYLGQIVYLSGGLALAAIGVLGLLEFLPPIWVTVSMYLVLGTTIFMEATGRLHLMPQTNWTKWFLVVFGVVLMLSAVMHGMRAYGYWQAS